MRIPFILAVAVAVITTFTAVPSVNAEPKIAGKRPPALAPFAADDPIPRLSFKPHSEQTTPRQAIETFLSYLASGENVTTAPTDGSIPGTPQAFEKAWELMTGDRISLSEFKKPWTETAQIRVVQLEPLDDNRFFVELHSLAYCHGAWASSLYAGHIQAVETPHGWRIGTFAIHPEHLVRVNVGGHPGMQHDEVSFAKFLAMPGQESIVENVIYHGRTATIRLKRTATRDTKTVRLARTMEGSWIPLSIK